MRMPGESASWQGLTNLLERAAVHVQKLHSLLGILAEDLLCQVLVSIDIGQEL